MKFASRHGAFYHKLEAGFFEKSLLCPFIYWLSIKIQTGHVWCSFTSYAFLLQLPWLVLSQIEFGRKEVPFKFFCLANSAPLSFQCFMGHQRRHFYILLHLLAGYYTPPSRRYKFQWAEQLQYTNRAGLCLAVLCSNFWSSFNYINCILRLRKKNRKKWP